MPENDAMMSTYFLTVARMEEHIVLGTKPSPGGVSATIDFALRALGLAN